MQYFNINGCPSQRGKVGIVTGANIGLGYETALALAKKEMTVVLACRDQARAEIAQKKIQSQAPLSEVKIILLDLSKRSSVEKFAKSFLSQFERLDMLINNAGIMVPPYKVTEDGWESQMAVNYFGHFLLTALLFPLLKETPGARVVSLSSVVHRKAKINFEDINSTKRYSRFEAYAQSKLACLMFALELDRRLKKQAQETGEAHSSSVLSLAAHPGLSLTNLGRHLPKIIFPLLLPMFFLAQSAKAGAQPILLAALGYPGESKEIKGGEYFGPTGFKEWKGRAGRAKIEPHAQDLTISKKLWETTEKFLNIKFF